MKDIRPVAAVIVATARLKASLSQRELAARARTTQAAVARIEGGRTSPTLATIARLVTAAGFQLRVDLVQPERPDATIDAFKRDIDRSLLRENLKKTPEQRVRNLTALAHFAREAQRAGRAARQPKRGRS
ncbi:MAG: helix-turn-helix domain-containing protein [Gemmatimonadaceae bacterium]